MESNSACCVTQVRVKLNPNFRSKCVTRSIPFSQPSSLDRATQVRPGAGKSQPIPYTHASRRYLCSSSCPTPKRNPSERGIRLSRWESSCMRLFLVLSDPASPLLVRRQKNIAKGEIALKHAAGLGHVPNAIPLTEPQSDGPPRSVEVGWHPVGGFAGKWFAEQTGLGKLITDKINKYPDPTQHWAVLVGEYAHQLWMVRSKDLTAFVVQSLIMAPGRELPRHLH